jgi:hypothetical protein
MSGGWSRGVPTRLIQISHARGAMTIQMPFPQEQKFFVPRFELGNRVVYQDAETKITHNYLEIPNECRIVGHEYVFDLKTGTARSHGFEIRYPEVGTNEADFKITNATAGTITGAHIKRVASTPAPGLRTSMFPKPNFEGIWFDRATGDQYDIQQGSTSLTIAVSNPALAFANPFFDGVGLNTTTHTVDGTLISHLSDWWGDDFYAQEATVTPPSTVGSLVYFFLHMQDAASTQILLDRPGPHDTRIQVTLER